MPDHKTPKLLAIDDEAQSLELIADALSNAGLEVLTAGDPKTGLEMFKRIRPQIVLLDLMMPGIQGFEMLEWILAADPGAEVILMTAHYSTESAVEAIQKGATDYLNKPLNVEKLRRRIRELLSDARNSAASDTFSDLSGRCHGIVAYPCQQPFGYHRTADIHP